MENYRRDAQEVMAADQLLKAAQLLLQARNFVAAAKVLALVEEVTGFYDH